MNESTKTEWCRTTAIQSRVLVDGDVYFRAPYRAFLQAKRRILIVGWQLDPNVRLLRGPQASGAKYPVALWPLLNALCEAKPELNGKCNRSSATSLASSIGNHFHDVQAAVRGEAAAKIEELFWSAWPDEADHQVEIADLGPADFDTICGFESFPIDAQKVSISRTQPGGDAASDVRETEGMYQQVISTARELIYIETQYFTSVAVARALNERMKNDRLPKLTVIVVMPDGADSPKERLVLGPQQARVVREIGANAEQHGHCFRVLKSVS